MKFQPLEFKIKRNLHDSGYRMLEDLNTGNWYDVACIEIKDGEKHLLTIRLDVTKKGIVRISPFDHNIHRRDKDPLIGIDYVVDINHNVHKLLEKGIKQQFESVCIK